MKEKLVTKTSKTSSSHVLFYTGPRNSHHMQCSVIKIIKLKLQFNYFDPFYPAKF